MRSYSMPITMIVFFWSAGLICAGSAIGAEVEVEVEQEVTAAAAPTITVRGKEEPSSLFEEDDTKSAGDEEGEGSDLLPVGQTVGTGKTGLIEIHIENQDVTKILKLLSLQSQRNIVASRNVSGSLSADLYGVDFYEALEAVLHANGFGYVEKGNFIYVYTAEELAAIQVVDRKVVTRVRRLNYINAAYAATVVQPMLSEQGSVAVNAANASGIQVTVGDIGGDRFMHRDTLVIRDYQDNLDEIFAIMDELDVRPPQIQIEATILDVRMTEANAFGVDLNVVVDNDFGVFPSVLNVVDDFIDGSIDGTTPVHEQLGDTSGFQSTPGNTASGDSTIKVGLVSNNVSVFMRALDRVSDTTVIARPKVLVTNRGRSDLLVGARLGYLSTTATETSTTQTVEFLDVGTQLTVQPHVLENDIIHVLVNPSVSDGSTTSVGGVVVPNETTSGIITDSYCRSGQTIVIGGLFKEDTIITRDQVPVAGSLPIVGAAFRGQDDDLRRSEVIFMIKPTVMRDNALIAGGNLATDNSEQARSGAREGLLIFSRTKQVAAHMRDAIRCYEAGDHDKALLYANYALQLDPTFNEARRMKEEITQKREYWPHHSILKEAVDAMADQQRQVTLDSQHQPQDPAQHEGVQEVMPMDIETPQPAQLHETSALAEPVEVIEPVREDLEPTAQDQDVEPVAQTIEFETETQWHKPISIEESVEPQQVEAPAPAAEAPAPVAEAPAPAVKKATITIKPRQEESDDPAPADDAQAQVSSTPAMFHSLSKNTRLEVITGAELAEHDKTSTQMLLDAISYWVND